MIEDIKIKEIKIRNNEVLVTDEKYDSSLIISQGIISSNVDKGTQKTYQTVVQVGPMARDVEVGDVVEIKTDRYLLRHVKDRNNSLRRDIPENHIKEEFGPDYKFPEIEIDGKMYIRIYDSDIDFTIKSYEKK